MRPADLDVRATIFALLDRRAAGATVCPSEVARALAPGAWRPLMPLVRDVVRSLAVSGELEVRQRGQAVDAGAEWRGPIRVGRALSGER